MTGIWKRRSRRARPLGVLGAVAALVLVAAGCDAIAWTSGPIDFNVPPAPQVTGQVTTTTTTAPPNCTLSGFGPPDVVVTAGSVGISGHASRTFRLGVPQSACYAGNPGPRLPLIIALHGGNELTGQFAADTELYPAGNTGNAANDFLVLFPQATSSFPTWNDGRSNVVPNVESVDDVGYLNALIDWSIGTGAVDAKRVYVLGYSNGAFMANRLACESTAKLAAAALVAGYGPDQPTSGYCGSPGGPLPIFVMSSTNDPTVPFDGGAIGCTPPDCPRGSTLSAAQFMNHAAGGGLVWGPRNGCTSAPAQSSFTTSAGTGTRKLWTCSAKPIRHDVLVGNYHTYYGRPGGPESVYRATDQAWAFLRSYSR